ncbi:MAG: peptidase M23 [Bacteroidetes bacterium MedPE-SWsnd-G1]|nr:MAG: peptidase M23 [Bacteroidetes bacterium MedPE-SWsnd-G1]
MKYNTIKISEKEAEIILLKCYNLEGKISTLPGELDFNFRVKVPNSDGYILKVSRPDENLEHLDFQTQLLEFVQQNNTVHSPAVYKDFQGKSISTIEDSNGNKRFVRLLSWISGRIYIDVNPQTNNLREQLGKYCGRLTTALKDFSHSYESFDFEWDVAQSLWTKGFNKLFQGEELEIVTYFQAIFENQQESYHNLRKQVVHNDANYDNVVVSEDVLNPKISSVIDFGDAIKTQVINDLAIACAYAITNFEDPLDAALPIVKGYHSSYSILEEELEHLYCAIAMRLLISVTKSAINKQKEPDNTYLQRSEKGAWDLLKKWRSISPDFALYSFRITCGFSAHPKEKEFQNWAATTSINTSELFPNIHKNEIHLLDLSVSSKWIGHQEEFNDLDLFQFKIDRLQKQHPNKLIAGGYLEPRPIYTSSEYDTIGNYGKESRTIHLGIDYWIPPSTPVHAILDAEVVIATNDEGDKEYGGLIVLKHLENNLEFYSLYGHLTVASATKYSVGEKIKKGEKIAEIGNHPENGNWAPHLHFQLMLSLLDYKKDFPGVAYHSQIDVWKSLCPDPNLIFKSEALSDLKTPSNQDLIAYRKEHLGKSLSLQYKVPIKMVRGAGQYLVDQFGKKYLDTVNNVAHVGHEHPKVVKAGKEQMALINTNTRYLHENINALAKELLETLPPELSVLHFVNSGSEANELAIRMVKANTGEKDIIASEVGYHGNANMCIDISSYKFDGKGGSGAPEHTQIFPLPDAFRGKYRGNQTGEKYAAEVQQCIDTIHNKKRGVGALIIEPIISCGGQIELPEGFLAKSYEYVRKAGGLCISDEVQTGCGRMGKTFWGFQLHNVIPDIVTIGKPLGNGHPIAAVACTQEVAEKFANGMEYFNTFGGNPVSCAIGAEVLKTVKRENLQQNALEVGEYLKSELKELTKTFPIIGDIRGQGLFLGIELVDEELNPLAEQTDYLTNRMKDHGILMSTDGPDHNVLKIKPPIVFTKENAKELTYYLKKIFAEDFMQI